MIAQAVSTSLESISSTSSLSQLASTWEKVFFTALNLRSIFLSTWSSYICICIFFVLFFVFVFVFVFVFAFFCLCLCICIYICLFYLSLYLSFYLYLYLSLNLSLYFLAPGPPASPSRQEMQRWRGRCCSFGFPGHWICKRASCGTQQGGNSVGHRCFISAISGLTNDTVQHQTLDMQ